MQIRQFKAGDEAALLAVFRSAVHQVAARNYSLEQVLAWAPSDLAVEEFGVRLRENKPFVAVMGLEPVGFADLQEDGYIDQFYVSGHLGGRGIGCLLMNHLEAEAALRGIKGLYSFVSLTAEPFFAGRGFYVEERRRPILRGVTFDNALMRKPLQ